MGKPTVFHKKYGEGVIEEYRNSDYVTVKFRKSQHRVHRKELLSEKPSDNSLGLRQITAPESDLLEPSQHTTFKARRLIEALRMGIVYPEGMSDFTFGRDDEAAIIMDWLTTDESLIPSTLFIEGGYGVGKTHLLEFTRERALADGYMVALVSTDIAETPFNRPKQVYAKVLQDLTYRNARGESCGYEDMLRAAFYNGFQPHDDFYHAIRHNIGNDAVWEWIKGLSADIRPSLDALYINKFGNPIIGYFANEDKHRIFPALYDTQNAGNIYTYLLSSLGWIAKEFLGLKGLLILFDESESFTGISTKRAVQMASSFLKAIILAADSDPELRKYNTHYGLDYSQRTKKEDPIPFLYEESSYLKLVFAFTDLSGMTSLDVDPEYMQLEALAFTDIASSIFDTIVDRYAEAYDLPALKGKQRSALERMITRNAPRASTRELIKFCVEVLDLRRHYPHLSIDDLVDEMW